MMLALIWEDLRATFGTRLAEVGCDVFTIRTTTRAFKCSGNDALREDG